MYQAELAVWPHQQEKSIQALNHSSISQWGTAWEQGLRQSTAVIWCPVETVSGLSHNWFVAATQMASSTEQRRTATTSSTRIAAGLILGLACLAAVLTGGIFVGQTIGEALSTLQAIAPVQVDPLR